MSEKEFILSVFENIWPDAALPEMMDEINERIDRFLDYHHQHYYEVDFIKKDGSLVMNTGEGKPTVHELYDGTTAVFNECWEDNEGFVHHIDQCKPGTCKIES